MPSRFVPVLFVIALVAAACTGGSDAAPTTTDAPTTTAPASTTTAKPAIAGCAGLPIGFTDIELTGGGAVHPVRVFVPSSFSGEAMPVVLNWHGLGSSGIEQLALSNYEVLAETEGFVVVHATGVVDPTSGRNSWELVEDQDPDRNDLAFVDVLIDELVDRWCADPDRVYSTGMSNGGLFTARLVCERAERIAAAVSVAGTSHQPDCEPSRSVPYLAFHGTADDTIPFDGSGESRLLGELNDPRLLEFFSQVMPEEFSEFAADAGCGDEPTVIEVSDEVVQYEYVGCEVPMNFFEIADGGHTWPGSPLGPLLEASLGYTTPDVSATVDGWAFMSQFTLAS